MRLESLLAFLCILSVLSATGYSLSCKVCMDMFSTFCDGPSMVCPADNACASSYTVTTAYGSALSRVFSMSCAPRHQCNMLGSVGVPNGKIKMSITCCYKDDCTPPMPTLPADNSQKNGLTCPTCTSADSTWCYTGDTMQCAGSENMCLLQTTENIAPIKQSVAVRGCATESICSLGTQRVEFGKLKSILTFSCNDGSVGLHSSLLFCITAAFSVLILMYSN
ncbi:phospholipase A2 inhibitor NAI-like [Mixophyes fleayi]|uniref:phospholipase A2 inhibitor NAI-like n=1 Tax=Mixophyes fleayi TaxID=3061075 RepID=UPI003F4E4366